MDAIWSEFKKDFVYRASKFIPHKMASCRKSPPWMCKSILRKIQARDRVHKVARRLGTQSAWSAYRCRRNRVVGALRSAKRELRDSLASQLKSPRDFWSAYHCLTKVYKRVPSKVSRGLESATTDTGKASLINDHFVSCFAPETKLPVVPAAGSHPTSISDLTCSSLDVLELIKGM